MPDLQALCELGQEQLMRMEYLAAEATLAAAEEIAWGQRDFDTLARLYLPLQEARRQRRQRCGEGTVCLDLLAAGPEDRLDARQIVDRFPHGQLLIGGWATLEPAIEARQLQRERGLYLDIFLAAAYASGSTRAIVIAPLRDSQLPPAGTDGAALSSLTRWPVNGVVGSESMVPRGQRPGTPETYGQVMALWETLHTPFLRAADAEPDLLNRIAAYRRVIEVDYACELAHQKLSDVAKELAREKKTGRG